MNGDEMTYKDLADFNMSRGGQCGCTDVIHFDFAVKLTRPSQDILSSGQVCRRSGYVNREEILMNSPALKEDRQLD